MRPRRDCRQDLSDPLQKCSSNYQWSSFPPPSVNHQERCSSLTARKVTQGHFEEAKGLPAAEPSVADEALKGLSKLEAELGTPRARKKKKDAGEGAGPLKRETSQEEKGRRKRREERKKEPPKGEHSQLRRGRSGLERRWRRTLQTARAPTPRGLPPPQARKRRRKRRRGRERTATEHAQLMTAALLGPDTRCRTAGSLRNPGLLVKTRIFAGEAGRQTPAENAGHGGEGGRADLVDNNLEQDAPGRDQLGADGAHAEEPAGAPPTGDEDPGRGARPDRRREGPLGRRHDRPASEGARAEPVGRVMEPSPVHRDDWRQKVRTVLNKKPTVGQLGKIFMEAILSLNSALGTFARVHSNPERLPPGDEPIFEGQGADAG